MLGPQISVFFLKKVAIQSNWVPFQGEHYNFKIFFKFLFTCIFIYHLCFIALLKLYCVSALLKLYLFIEEMIVFIYVLKSIQYYLISC